MKKDNGKKKTLVLKGVKEASSSKKEKEEDHAKPKEISKFKGYNITRHLPFTINLA